MAIKLETLAIVVIAAVLVMQAFQGQVPVAPTDRAPTTGGIDLCEVVEPEISLTGQRMFLQGTTLTTEYARIIRDNGDGTIKDLGQTSMNSGTQSTSAKKDYLIYWGENSTTRYTHKEKYTAPCEDATDDKVGVLCTIDDTPSITVFDEYGNAQGTQEAGTNAQAIGSSEAVDMEVEIKVSADQCYGNPDAPAGKMNALCFQYNTTVFKTVALVGADPVNAPYTITTNKTSGLGESCFGFKPIADNEKLRFPLKLETKTGQNPGLTHNITIRPDDIAFDLDQDTLGEIWDYQDESLNELGSQVTSIAHVLIS